jgi:hypothetical protein
MARALLMDGAGSIAPQPASGPEPAGGQPLILLVHGYNNDTHQAAESYFLMRRNLDHLLRLSGVDEAVRKSFQSRMWELYWPAYAPMRHRAFGRPRPKYEHVVAPLSYSLEVIRARTAVAGGLAQYLTRRAPSEVFFIAHSLGCRVVLETIKLLAPVLTSPIQLSGFLLMAGAVPVDMLDLGGLLGPGALRARRRYCLHSWRDTVLLTAFPPGQVLAGEAPLYGLPLAAGLTGSPRSLWHSHANTHINHGAYWREGLFKGGTALSQLCAGIFGVAIDREISLSELPRVRTDSALSILPENQLPTGRLPGSDWLEATYGSPRRQP